MSQILKKYMKNNVSFQSFETNNFDCNSFRKGVEPVMVFGIAWEETSFGILGS